jgi:hypothetical protein
MADDEGRLDLAWVGVIIYGIASGAVTGMVIMDYLANLSVYTSSYLMGALPFIILNLVVMVWFIRAVFRAELRWYLIIAPAISYILISWLFHGISPLWRTIVISAMVFIGIILIGISMRANTHEGQGS